MIKPKIEIIEDEHAGPAPASTFSLPSKRGTLLSERMGLPQREIPAWARSFDWTAEDDDE